jgi:2'-hydroxyisoflavone reductase
VRLLVIGGTRFLGRHLVAQALAGGHQVTLMHRGRSGAGLHAEAEHRIADRDGDLGVLAGGTWDAVIDTCAYVPRQVRAMTAALSGRAGHYQLVSSVSAHAEPLADYDEAAPLATLADPATETVDGSTYGGLKALCEQALQATWPAAGACVVRPGLIAGPHDPTGRLTWWVHRLSRGGEVLAPGDPDAPVQVIDARDLAAFMLSLAQRGAAGAFNATGPVSPPEPPLTMRGLLETARELLNPQAALTWVDEPFLLEHGVQPWIDLPLWLDHANAGLATARLARARAAGLACRPLAHTLRDIAAWAFAEAGPAGTAAGPARPPVGLDPPRVAALLAAWHARSVA